MNRTTRIIFFILELGIGLGIGLLGFFIIADELLVFDMNLSIIVGFLTLFLFALIGIAIPGFFHSRAIDENRTFLTGMAKATIGMAIGMLISIILPNEIHHGQLLRYITILIPVFCAVVGFNMGIGGVKNVC